MANFMYTHALAELMNGTIDLEGDIRALLCMTNTTADTDEDVDDIDEVGTLDECDDNGYSRQALTSESVTEDEANDQGEFSSDNIVFANDGDATREIAGMMIYFFVSDDTDSIPLCWIDDSATYALTGATVTYNCPAEGWFKIANA